MTRQDNKFEAIQCDVFGFNHIDRRSNIYVPDALILLDNKIYRGELKSCDGHKGLFSTSSRMGVDKVNQWKLGFDWAIFSIFSDDKISESYFLTHQHLQPFYKEVTDKQMAGHAGRAGLSSWMDARKVLENCNFANKRTLDRLEKQNKFGSRINDPRIATEKIKKWGIKINDSDCYNHVRSLIREHCFDAGWNPNDIDVSKPPKGFTKKRKICPTLSGVLEKWRHT